MKQYRAIPPEQLSPQANAAVLHICRGIRALLNARAGEQWAIKMEQTLRDIAAEREREDAANADRAA